MSNILIGIFVFITAAVVDAVWAKYIETASAGKAGAAAAWSGMILICGSLITIQYVANRWMIIPSVLGGIVGTYLTIKYKGTMTDWCNRVLDWLE